jgi:hypothetical protein
MCVQSYHWQIRFSTVRRGDIGPKKIAPLERQKPRDAEAEADRQQRDSAEVFLEWLAHRAIPG